jgi:DNA-binding transcriptional LysR family regulator
MFAKLNNAPAWGATDFQEFFMSISHMADALIDLYLLTVISETRSLTQAARRLGISKATVSDHLRQLERTVGMSLVRRTTRSIALTAAAQQLVDDTHSSFTRIGQSLQQIRDLAGSPRGVLRVTAPVALGRQRIAPAVPEFVRRFPEIRLDLDLSDRLVNLAQEGFDVAIRHARSVPETYVANVLCDSRSLLLATPDYLQRRGTPKSPADLAHHACLLYLRNGSTQSWSFEKISSRRRKQRVSIPVGGPFRANNSEVLRAAIRGGMGIGLLPDFSSVGELRSGALTQVLPDWRPVGFFGDRIYAVRPGSAHAPRTVVCLIEFLREVFQKHPVDT